MKNAILVHGWVDKDEFYDPKYPTGSNGHWIPWLSKRLMMKDIHTVAPEMPGYVPNYQKWKKEFERFDIGPETILVGHSCGGGFLVHWLSQNPDKKVGKVVLVAPWVGVRFNDNPIDETFFEFEFGRSIANQTNGLHIFNSLDDMDAVLKSVEIIREKVDDIEYHEFKDKGHFTFRMNGEFPELLEEILK